jgi:hypothetical protein
MNIKSARPVGLQHQRQTRIFVFKARPKRGTLVRYGERIAEVLGEARGERVMIRSLHADGLERRSAVKWQNLRPLDDQLF